MNEGRRMEQGNGEEEKHREKEMGESGKGKREGKVGKGKRNEKMWYMSELEHCLAIKKW